MLAKHPAGIDQQTRILMVMHIQFKQSYRPKITLIGGSDGGTHLTQSQTDSIITTSKQTKASYALASSCSVDID